MVYLKIFIFIISQFFSLKNYSKCYKYKDNKEKKINKINIKKKLIKILIKMMIKIIKKKMILLLII